MRVFSYIAYIIFVRTEPTTTAHMSDRTYSLQHFNSLPYEDAVDEGLGWFCLKSLCGMAAST